MQLGLDLQNVEQELSGLLTLSYFVNFQSMSILG